MASDTPERRRWISVDRRRARRFGLVSAGVLTAVLSVAAAFAFGSLLYVQGEIQIAEDVNLKQPLPNEPFNVLVIGSDSREGLSEEEQATKGSTEDVPGQRADTIVLLHVEPRSGKAVLVHFPRDLRVRIPGEGMDRINKAFEGGRQRLVETVEAFSGLEIHHYVEVDFAGFSELVDAMGGVPICVDRPLHDELAELNLPRPGCYTLGGKAALAFVRARNVEGDVIPDFARIARQQQFIRAVLDKVLSPASTLRMPALARTAVRNLTVDRGLTVIDVNDIARKLQGLGTSDVDFRVVPATPVTINGASYVQAIQPQTSNLFARIERGQPLGNLGRELALTDIRATISVRVLDAGGEAALVRDRLSKGGFEVLPTLPAPAGQDETVILFGGGREPQAASVAEFLADVVGLPPVRVERTPPGLLQGAEVGIVVAPDFEPSEAS